MVNRYYIFSWYTLLYKSYQSCIKRNLMCEKQGKPKMKQIYKSILKGLPVDPINMTDVQGRCTEVQSKNPHSQTICGAPHMRSYWEVEILYENNKILENSFWPRTYKIQEEEENQAHLPQLKKWVQSVLNPPLNDQYKWKWIKDRNRS